MRRLRGYAGYRHDHSRYLPCHAIPAVSNHHLNAYLFNLRMGNVRLYALGVKCGPIYGARGKHYCGKSAESSVRGKYLKSAFCEYTFKSVVLYD